MKRVLFFSLSLSILLGCLTAWIDSYPGWDDAGISAVLVLSIAALSAYAGHLARKVLIPK